VSEQLLAILKFCLLALIYLFFFRVLRAVWAEITPPKVKPPRRPPAPPPVARKPAKPPKPTRRPKGAPAGRPTMAGPPPAGAPYPSTVRDPLPAPVPAVPGGSVLLAPAGAGASVGRLITIEPATQRGVTYSLGDEITVGRAPGCHITIADDTFVSQLHARVFRREGNYLVEDLGSTNGTYLNQKKVSGVMIMQRGDRLQVGNTVLELE
jgi:hypothetical protein